MQTITVFRGDGIGPEITDVVLEILDAAGAQLNYEIFDVGEAVYQKTGEFIPQNGLDSFDKTKVLLKSPITTPIGKGFRSLNVTLRNKYDLWANIRPAKSNPCLDTLFKDIDIVTFRENTEDLYVGKEEVIDDNTVIAYKIITKKASKRIIKAAFEYAITHNRKKVTCVHKANILKKTDGLFLSIFEEIAKDYPQIEANALIVDNTCMQLVMHPQQFDVMVMPNLYGDIISDLTSGLIGGLGLLPSCNKGDTHAMYEAVHGSAPDIAGKGIANPTALLLSSCMMLEDLGQQKTAIAIRKAVDKVFADKTCLTPDLGGNASTKRFVQSIIDHLKKDEG
ncbi:MAG: isocitrate/isopropylmalate dehydrogenase family protein [Erysipelotrichaceae bacterium]|uniref:isocitrate/isopropylmalate dehydrogenase family protein n=1 Tax=Faecalicoccus sp. TaxID=1971758 RepID=UPI002A7F1ED4|nr:isocitrate/isopropylmalate dehydrogenase family protein [Faecalicoccus sp.]MBE6120790.1 isocitrate/isopropylmalate dehydrogenase family protein [Erysipelotrichaceae bacterium]MDY4279450.1 isocitrate/isopropylmalate dehydrogenase family protein [Faecalicoccus sp.]